MNARVGTRQWHLLRAATLVIGAASATAGAVPLYTAPSDVPEALRFDLIVAAATLALDLPTAPSGRGTALESTAVADVADAGYRAEQGYLLKGPPDDNNAGVKIEPKAGTFKVVPLSGDKSPLTLDGKGAIGVDEAVPSTVRVRNADGGSTVRDVVARVSGALGAAGELTDATHGVIAGGHSVWATVRDSDPDAVGDQGGLLQTQWQMIARSEGGPVHESVSAGLTRNVFTALPRGSVALSPVLTSMDLVTTLGLPEAPKPDREGRAIFNFEGLVSFSPDPLWSWTVEYKPDGTVLQSFKSSAALRQADNINARLDDAAVQAILQELLHIDEKGVLGTAGVIDINDRRLFNAQIASPRRFDYTQIMTLYVGLDVAEPSSLALAVTAFAASGIARRRRAA